MGHINMEKRERLLWMIRIYAIIILAVTVSNALESAAVKIVIIVLSALIIVNSFLRNKK